MRAALWLLALFAVAVATALFAGNNQSTLTLFWPPHRIDLSLNLVLMALVAAFVVLHLALRALSALFEMPVQARRWRASPTTASTRRASRNRGSRSCWISRVSRVGGAPAALATYSSQSKRVIC